jgi:xanthine dehydrogenase accessory factor
VAFVGAMGSRRTHEDRLARLGEAGLGEDELARLSSPIGLDLGARTPEETAVSIAAEIVALRWGGHGDRLAHREGPIHHHGAELTSVPSPAPSPGEGDQSANHPQ